MKTVVTGGAGFIGSHLVKRLTHAGREVVVADDFSRGSVQDPERAGFNTQLCRVDLRDYEQVLSVIEGATSVFHLAARIGSIKFLHGSDNAELLALQTNLVIDANVFRACLESGVRRLVYASSVSVYPMDLQRSHNVTLKELDLRYVNPDGGYGWAKLLGEIQLQWMGDIDVGIARIFNVYGEGEEPDIDANVIPALIRKAVLHPNEELRVWGDGSQTRDFLYVTDCVEALIRLEEKASHPPVVVNVGSGQALSVKELIHRIVAISGRDLAPVFDSTMLIGPLSRTADISKAKILLSWEPRVHVKEGLEITFRWVEKRLRQWSLYSQ